MAKGQKRTDATPKSSNDVARKAKKAAGPKYLRDAMTTSPNATALTAKGKAPRGSKA
ncbi:hypothetical protein [Acuticoccus yangtzensis]|uniref:hypothetical protein n=1 Tax=Acuticoccus yangtzensis TaxID=1443441 RepID=UPI000ABB2B51|nr:hypothetical protein [Acuticoccus yangtzensis]